MTLLQIVTSFNDTFTKVSTQIKTDSLINLQKSAHVDTVKQTASQISNVPADSTLVDSNVIAAVIGALATLICTIFWERIKVWLDARRERRKKLIYFASLVKPIITYSEKQSSQIKEFAEAIKNNPLEFPLLKYSPKSAIEKIVTKIDEEAFFNSFTTYYKPYPSSVKNFKAITSIIEYQNLQLDQVLEMVKSSQQFDHKRKENFQHHFGTAMQLAGDSIAKGVLQEHPKLLELLDKSLVQYIGERPSPSDLKFAYENFVVPVKDGIVANSFYNVPIGLEIANNLQNATHIYHDVLMQMEALQSEIAEIADNYRTENENLKTASYQLISDFFKSDGN